MGIREAFELAGFGTTVSALETIFADMEVAEQEVAAGEERHPMEADLVHDAFRLLRRTQFVRTDALYHIHCREIVDRVAAGKSPLEATDAELLGALMELALQAPLVQDASALYHRLFRRWFPDRALEIFEVAGDWEPRGSHATAVDDLDALFWRKIREDLDVVEARGKARKERAQ